MMSSDVRSFKKVLRLYDINIVIKKWYSATQSKANKNNIEYEYCSL